MNLDRIWTHAWRVLMWAVLLLSFFLAGYNMRLSATETIRRAEILSSMGYTRLAMFVPQEKRKCAMEWHEGCLVCEHKMLRGTVKSTMC